MEVSRVRMAVPRRAARDQRSSHFPRIHHARVTEPALQASARRALRHRSEVLMFARNRVSPHLANLLQQRARAMRFYLVAALLYFFGPPIKEFIEKRLTLVTNQLADVTRAEAGLDAAAQDRSEADLLMAYAHVAHDCVLGNGVILANGVGLAGHVRIDDNATVGGLAAVHQYCRIGRLAFIGGGSMVEEFLAERRAEAAREEAEDTWPVSGGSSKERE